MTRTSPLPPALCSVLAAGSAVAAPAFEPKVELDHPSVLAAAPGSVYVLVELDAPKGTSSPARAPLDLALVIDRSGSMEDKGKIEYAREAALRLVDGLGPDDRLAVIVYDDRVDLLWPSQPVGTAAGRIKALIRGVNPGGSTNLAGGLFRGADELVKRTQSGTLSRVVLLTDGLANAGLTDPGAIAAKVRTYRARGVQVATMGLGAEYNEDLLQAVAEAGGGRYHFIEHPNQMARIFAEELSLAFAAVAKDVVLKLDLGDRVERAEVIGYTAMREGKRTIVPQEDLHAGEHRSVLIRADLRPGAEGQVRLGTLLVEYLDLADREKKSVEREILVDATSRPEVVAAATNPRVIAESALIDADRDHLAQIQRYEQGDEAGAKSQLAALEQKLSHANNTLKDKRIAKKIEALQLESARMDRAKQSANDRSLYLKKGKLMGSLGSKGKRASYLLEEGARGYEVERLQTALAAAGLYKGAVDGEYDAEVKAAVEAYQAKEQLEADGVAGPATLERLGLY